MDRLQPVSHIMTRGVESVQRTQKLGEVYRLFEVMTPEPASVTPATPVREAAELLAEGRFHALPVVDGAGHLKGILTSTDLIRWLLTL